MIKIGKVVAVDETSARVRVQLDDCDGMVTYWLQIAVPKSQNDKFYWIPDIGEQVLCAFLEHGLEHGFVIGALYNEKDKVPVGNKDKYFIRFQDGTEIEYDRATHRLRADVKGDVELKTTGRADIDCNGQIYIKSTTNITIQAPSINMKGGSPAEGWFEGNFRLIGNLEVQGNIYAAGSIIDEGGNTNHHSH
jgi:phage baseplate assembly protein V